MSGATALPHLFSYMPMVTEPSNSSPRSVSNPPTLRSVPGFLSERVRSISEGGVKVTSGNWSISFPPPLCPGLQRTSRDLQTQPRAATRPRILHEQQNDETDSQSSSSTTTRSSQWTWRVTPAMLEPVPSYYPLEHSSVTIRDMPHVISARISNFMKLNSIACSYRFGTAMVQCTTLHLTKFSLNLWKGTENGTVIMELRRLHGCCWEMLQVRNDLVQAVTNGQVQSSTRRRQGRSCSRLLQEMYQQQHHSDKDDRSKGESCVSLALQLLHSDHRDQKRLGMESLHAMSKPTCRDSAECFSQSLIFDHQGEKASFLRDSLVEYFYNVERPSDTVDSDDEFSYQDYEMDQEPEYARGCHFGDMHNLALKVLANALEVAATRLESNRESSSSVLLLNQGGGFWGAVVEALVYNLTVSSYRPHEAALSAKCLFLITQLVPTSCSFMVDRLLPALIEANEYGKLHHLKLETETQNLLDCLVQAA